ncbi:hypothetical protein FOZ60_009678 [Perkinsus olseni]|uniref:Protein kinase domain-containing protein n=2 Tax=Perkinsus olseni TaxID=32597 RepID=A0A7J6PD75_PEROL|nr:hypothetical protein FOZ60_009678 [Perkinsus olseni]
MSDSDSRHSTTSWDVDPSSLPPGITPEFGPLADPKRYLIGREIGAGATARVFKCKRQKDGRVFAVKCLFVQRARLSEEFDRELDALHKEIGILSRLKHRNIVALYDVVETQAAVYIVMEYVGGGELFDYVVDNENFNNENVIRFVFCQVVDALLYLHVNGVIHRDLKPENILVSSMATSCPSGYEEVPGDMPAYPIVKLADFGLSKAVQNASSLAMTWVGTPQYWAPEVIKAQEDKVGYDGRADNWSLGVLLYVMLGSISGRGDSPSNHLREKLAFIIFWLPAIRVVDACFPCVSGKRYPFTGQHMNDQIRVGQFKFRKMDHVSAEAKDLVSRLIVVNPNDRISLEDALGHPWLKNFPPAQALQQIWVPESRVPQLTELYSTLTARAIGYEPAAPVTKTSTVLKPTSIAEAPSPLASFHEPGEDSPMTIDDDDYSPIEGVQVEHLNSRGEPMESGDVTRKPSRQEEHHHQHASWAVQNRSGSRSPVSDAANRVVVPNLAANLGKKAAQDFRLDELCTAQLNILKIFQQIYIHFRHHPVVAQLVQAMIFEARELQTQTTVMLSRCGDIAEVVRKDLSDMVLFAEEGMPDEAMAGLDSVKAKLQGMSTSSEELHAHYVEFEGKVQKIIQREITAKAILDAKEVIDSDVKMSTDGPKISFVETTSSANGSSVGGGGDTTSKRTVSRRSKRANERLDSLLDRLRNLPPDEKVISTADGKGDAIDPEAAELLDLPFLAAGYVGGYSQEHKKQGASSDESAEVSDKELDSPRGTAWATPERASKKSGEDESKSSGKGPVSGNSEATGQLAVARKQPNGAPDPTAALIADSMRKLRRIDQILHKVTVFWQGVDQSVAKLSDMRENAARLLAGTTKSARILAVFRDRAREYDEFWKTYEDVCKQYADASTRQMQAYLEDMNLVYAQVDDFDLKSAAAAGGGARDGDASPPPAPSLVARQGSAASMRLALADATGAALTGFLLLHEAAGGKLKRPDKDKKKWEPKVFAASKNVNYNLYANGRGWVKSNGKSDCDGKWKDAETYGARKKKIKQFCIRLHEKHQDDRGYTDAPKRYDCRLDPNDKGNDHGRKNRDWLCYEKEMDYVLMPPHGPGLNSTCPSTNPWLQRALSWYPRDSPPKWCEYNWFEKRQVCWCMPGFYRESPYDKSLSKRGCPDEEIFIVPNFVKRTDLRKLEANDGSAAPMIDGTLVEESSTEDFWIEDATGKRLVSACSFSRIGVSAWILMRPVSSSYEKPPSFPSWWCLLITPFFMLICTLMVVARFLLQFIAVPYIATMMIEKSTWSIRELHVGKEVPCVGFGDGYTCYECRTTLEVSGMQFPAKVRMPPAAIYVSSGPSQWFLGHLVFPALTLADAGSINKFVSKGDLFANGHLSVRPDLLTDPFEIRISVNSDVQLFGFPVTDIVMVKDLSVPLRNFTVAI